MNHFYRLLLLLVIVSGTTKQISAQAKFNLSSPDGEIRVSISLKDKIYYSISSDSKELLSQNHLGLALRTGTLGENPKLISSKRQTFRGTITPYIALKFSTVENDYNSLKMNFKGNYSVEFRAFNDGIAYRFITNKKAAVEVLNEDITINFPADYLLHLQQPSGFKTSSEEAYTHIKSKDWKSGDKMSTLPVLIDTQSPYKIIFSESDLIDYPGTFLKGSGENGIVGISPKVPLAFGPDGDRSVKILKEADYIAKTKGSRTFPWRYFVITKDDGKLIENTMSVKLAPKSAITNPSWIKPGQVSWEWWNDAAPYGPDVNFKSGYNLETYKYYIDFASKFGIKYIIMDEGWAKSTRDPYTPNPKIDLQELIKYGKSKNVDIVLWLTWLTVDKNMELFKTFKEWGIKGVKIDFMDRSDQWMVNYYERVVKEAARNELFVDFHGAFKPSGLEYKYPNLISYEGVRGMENMEGCYPDNSIYFPFIRNVVGAMDYTPGAMLSTQPESYCSARPNAASIGTRAYQLSLFVIFESGLQMLADNPTLYYRNPDCTNFITSVPTTWDETRALSAKVGEVAVVAKRKGLKWFIGGMTNNEQNMRNIEINFDFLEADRTYTMNYFEDGINANRQAMDYRNKTIQVKKGDRFTINMARNGGFAAVLN